MAIQGASGFGKQRPDLQDAFYQYDAAGAQWIAPRAMPIVPVNIETGTLEVLSKENFTDTKAVGWARGANVNKVDTAVEALTYSCKRDGLALAVDALDSSVLQLNKDRAAAAIINHHIMKAWETKAAAVIQNTGTFTGSDLYLDTAAVWSAAATDIIGDVAFGTAKVIANSEVMPDTLVLSYVNLAYLKKNTAIRACFPNAPVITDAMIMGALPDIFGLKKLIVGTTGIFSSSYVSLCKTADSDMPNETCAFRTMGYTPDLTGGGARFDEYISPDSDERMIRGRMTYATALMLAEAAFLFKVD